MLIFVVKLTGKEFQGRRLKVSMARRKTQIPMRDGMMGRGGKSTGLFFAI